MFNSTAKDLCPSYQGGWWGHFAQSKFAKKVDKFWHHCQCGKGPMWYKHLGATSTITRHQVVVWGSGCTRSRESLALEIGRQPSDESYTSVMTCRWWYTSRASGLIAENQPINQILCRLVWAKTYFSIFFLNDLYDHLREGIQKKIDFF